MSTYVRSLCITTLAAALGCGDSAGEPADGSSSGEPTGTQTSSTPVTGTETGPTGDTTLDSGSEDPTAGTPAEIEVTIEGRPVPNGGDYELGAPVEVGAMGSVTVTIENTGGTELNLSSVVLNSEGGAHFVLDAAGLDPVVAAGSSTSVTVTFGPTNGGFKAAQLSIDSDDADESAYAVTLHARTSPNTYRDLAPATLPSGRFNMGLAATDDGRVLLFGGRQANGARQNDTWVFDVEAGDWAELSPAMSPSVRDALGMAYVGNGLFVLFGGTETNGPDETLLDDTWIFDLATGEWTQSMPAESPPARYQHRMVAGGEGVAIAYGGRPDFGMEFEDTWAFDVATETWTDLAPATSPGPRSALALAFDGVDTIALVGGSTNSVDLSDETWLYSVARNDWTPAAAAGAGPQFNNVAAWFGETLITTTGKPTCCDEPVPGTWAYDAVGDAWSEITPDTEPAPRFSHRMVYVGEHKAIIFGGLLLNIGPGSAVAETWEYVGP